MRASPRRLTLASCFLVAASSALAPGPAVAEYQWWHDMIGATLANQNALNNGAGVAVGVLDTRSDAGHPELAGRLADFPVPGGVYEFTFDDGRHTFLDLGDGPPGSRLYFDPTTGSWHGTHVSGIIGAARDGVGMVGIAPQADIVNAGVLDTLNLRGRFFSSLTPDTLIQDALAFVGDQGATVANMSLGPVAPAGLLAFESMLQGISDNRDRLVVAKAAGNSGVHLLSQDWDTDASPLDNLLIVGAVGSDAQIASFSNTPGNGCFLKPGSSTCRDQDRFRHRFLVAPGVFIGSPIPRDFGFPGDIGFASGTSMAAPMVAGAAALLQSRWEFLKSEPHTTVDILLDTADRSGHLSDAQIYGRGLLDIEEAMQAQGATTIAVGATVDGPSHASSDSALLLPAALGGHAAILAALDGMVIFDRYRRDFQIDPRPLVAAPSAAFSLDGIIRSRFEMAERGMFVSLPVPDGLVTFSAVVPQPGGERQTAALAQLRPSSDVFERARERDPVWRLDGKLGAWRFSIGQRAAPADVAAGATGAAGELFLFEAGGPFQPLGLGGQELHGFARYALSQRLGLAMGFARTGIDASPLGASGTGRSYLVQADFKPVERIGLQATHTLLSEEGMVLGGASSGALALGAGARTRAYGAAASLDLTASLTARVHMTEAATEVAAGGASLFRGVHTLRSRAYGGSLTKTGVFGPDDALGFSVSKPLRVRSGSAVLDVPVGRTFAGDVEFRRSTVELAPQGSQTDFELAYRAQVGPAFTAGVNLFYRHELNHQPRAWDAGVLSRMRLTF